MLIESNELREEFKKPVWTDNSSPDYVRGWKDACAGVEECIKRVEENQCYRNEVEKAQKDVDVWRIEESAKAILTNDEVKRPIIERYYELTNRKVELETMPLKDVPIGGVIIDKFVDRIDAYVKTARHIGTDELTFEVWQIYSSAGMPKGCKACFYTRYAKVVYTGFRIKDWGKLK